MDQVSICRQRDTTTESKNGLCGKINLEYFESKIINNGIAAQLNKTQKERFSKLVPIEECELDYAIEICKNNNKRNTSYLLSIIENQRRDAEQIAKGPAPPVFREKKYTGPMSYQERGLRQALEYAEVYNARIRAEEKQSNSDVVQREGGGIVLALPESSHEPSNSSSMVGAAKELSTTDYCDSLNQDPEPDEF